jgi:hypothetical protein
MAAAGKDIGAKQREGSAVFGIFLQRNYDRT